MTSFGSHEQPTSELLDALENVISLAHEDLVSEAQMDLAQEVVETVRHEHMSVYWRDRVGDARTETTLHILHEAIPTISGSVSWVTPEYLELVSPNGIYLISVGWVWAISGLSSNATITDSGVLDAQLANTWLHDLSDQHIDATWFIGEEKIIVGKCMRIGPDAIDIQNQDRIMSLMSKKIGAIRISPSTY